MYLILLYLIIIIISLISIKSCNSYKINNNKLSLKYNKKDKDILVKSSSLFMSSTAIMSSNENNIKSLKQNNQLYFMHFCFAFTSRMWDMAITLLIAELTNNSLKIVAMSGLMSSALSLIAMPKIGSWLDRVDRLKAAKITLFYKLTSVSLAYLLCAYLNHKTAIESLNSNLKLVLFYILPILYSIAGVSFATITQQIETDWIVVISNKDENWLRITNAFLSQIDLGCKALAPAVTGLLFAKFSQSNVSFLLVGFSTLVTIVFYQFIDNLYHKFPNLAKKDTDKNYKNTDKSIDTIDKSDMIDNNEKIIFLGNEWNSNKIIGKFLYGFKSFSTSGCAGLMIAYSFLYLTVLSFGSLMTVYLRSTGMNQSLIGTFKGLAALTEFTGAALFPYFSKNFGDWKTGYFSIWYQFTFILLASISMLLFPLNKSNMIIAIAVLFSRAGLWMFDLTTRQIAQVTIKENTRGIVNGQWKSIISFFDMFGYFLAVLFSQPDQFNVLTTISAIMVGMAALAYTSNIPNDCKLPYRINNIFPTLQFKKNKIE